jgi:hypothetical protein
MRLNIVYKAVAPDPPYQCELVEVDTAAVPFMLYGLWLKAQRYFWADTDSWRTGRWLMNKEGAALLMSCGTDIVNAIDRLTVTLEGRLTGTIRSVTGTGTEADPFVYSPPIWQDGGDPLAQPGSLLGSLHYHSSAWENLLKGSASADFPDDRSFRDQLEAIRAILETTEADSDDVEAILNLILLALA